MPKILRRAGKRLVTYCYRFKSLKPFIWKHITQPLELQFHVHDTSRETSEQFRKEIASLFEYFGFSARQFANKTIVDIGAGSHLVTAFFQDAKIIAIEPLADRYLKEIPSCGLRNAHKIYSSPAETRLEELKSAADFVISINVLDHVLEYDTIVENISYYMKPGSSAFLSFDSHDYIDVMHPTILTEEKCRKSFESVGLFTTKVSRGLTPSGSCPLACPKGFTYGHGETLNFWLTKPAAG
jgi:2-polyprenyl-3-methyl-5-hydroxy-6-metoxy-1,4-benzoquinol methylase